MTLSSLLGRRFQCDCGRAHDVPVRRFLYDPEVVRRLPEIIEDCLQTGQPARTAIVADARTWAVCGQRVAAALKGARHFIVPDTEHGGPVCDDVTEAIVLERLGGMQPEFLIAVGSGVINDLCKWTSFVLEIPYIVVGTAGSMNGYAAANVAATMAGVKVLVEARAPLAVLAEPAVIEQAPGHMITAGFGDTIAKFQSNTDWRMNHLLLDEYYCDFCAGIVSELEHLYLERPQDIAEGKGLAIKGLFEALFWTGLAMTLVGTSAPASGGEHLLSHTLDMVAGVRGWPHDLHGRQVGLGTLLSAALYERVMAVEDPTPRAMPLAIDTAFWAVPTVVDAVKSQYEAKRPALDLVQQSLVKGDRWDRLRAELAARSKPPETIRAWLTHAGGAVSASDIGCSRRQLKDAVLHMHEIRKRFTVVDLAWLLGILPGAVDEIIDTWL